MLSPAKLPDSFKSLGLSTPQSLGWRRLLVASEGLQKSGKTHFGLTMPAPVAVLNFDDGIEGVIDKFIYDKAIGVMDVQVPVLVTNGLVSEEQEKAQAHFREAWIECERKYIQILNSKDIRSLLVDTDSDFWTLLKLAKFGKPNPKTNIRREFDPVNQHMRSLIRMAYDRQINVTFIHRLKPKYDSKILANGNEWSDWDGKSYKRDGFGDSGYLVQVNIQNLYNPETKEFGFRVLDCRQNPNANGQEFWGSDCNFKTLGMIVFEDTDEKDWE